MRGLSCAVLLFAGSRVALAQPAPESPPPTDEPPPPSEPDVQPPVIEPPASTEPQTIAAPTPQPARPPTATSDVGIYKVGNLLDERGFLFGSYGRVIAGSDLRGGKPEAVNVVAHGPRIVEPSYLELDFSYGFQSPSGMNVRPVITLALDGTLFHDTGDFDAQPALRNMYLTAQVTKHVTAWVGSRMYRGDDIYLFDYWPLDELNTVGGGLTCGVNASPDQHADRIETSVHVGVNRLNQPFQFQEIDVPDPEHGATTVVQLNRQRMVASLSSTYFARNSPDKLNLKAKLHGEFHALPAGTRERTDGTLEALPADRGFLVGGQVSAWGLSSESDFRRHANLYVRYARGLAAYDELAPPTSFGPELETSSASELTFGASANWDHAVGNVMLGALSRRFLDADRSTRDPDDGWEYAVDLRPLLRIRRDTFFGADVSYQARFPRGLNPNTLRAEDPAVFQVAPMLVYSPMGASAYSRPQLRLVYRAAHLNEAARHLYVPDDIRSTRTWVHFLGLQAEWWWASSTYK